MSTTNTTGRQAEIANGVFAAPSRRTYTVIYDDLFTPGMSARAWGVFCYLMTRPPGWQCRIKEIASHFREGDAAIATALQELVDLALLLRSEWRDGNLKRTTLRLNVDMIDNPRHRNVRKVEMLPEPDFQDLGAQDVENRPLVSKEVVSTEVEDPASPSDAEADQDRLPLDLPADPQPKAKPKAKRTTKTATQAPPKAVDEVAATARKIVETWWEDCTPRPVQEFIAVVKRVEVAVKAEVPPGLVVAALQRLHREGLPITANTLPMSITECASASNALTSWRPWAKGAPGRARKAPQAPRRVLSASEAKARMAEATQGATHPAVLARMIRKYGPERGRQFYDRMDPEIRDIEEPLAAELERWS